MIEQQSPFSGVLSPLEVERQRGLIQKGAIFVKLLRPATLGDGIEKVSSEEAVKYSYIYKSKKQDRQILKFVPSSGAATRMFKDLYRFLEDFNPHTDDFQAYVSSHTEIGVFFSNIDKFAFYPLLKGYISRRVQGFDTLPCNLQKTKMVEYLLGEPFNFGSLAKGLLPFHIHSEKVVTAFEEHFREAVLYACSGDGKVNLHFTISPSQSNLFLQEVASIRPVLEKRYKLIFDVTFSFQDSRTDSIALYDNGDLVLDDSGQLLLRPSGHGALLGNLNQMLCDIIFIKNIDNVVSKSFLDETIFYKEVLAGKLEDIRSKAHRILKNIEKDDDFLHERDEILAFLKEINIFIPSNLSALSNIEFKQFVFESLNRPIRVCGMVENQSEPGGGPFWVMDKNGKEVLQIIEGAQIDKNNQKQKEIFEASTHFNPVDMVCYIKDYLGNTFDLNKFCDESQYLVVEKTYKGEKIHAMERPGLWNGAMANWISVFVEVPLSTFNPVKKINDLLKEKHLNTKQ